MMNRNRVRLAHNDHDHSPSRRGNTGFALVTAMVVMLLVSAVVSNLIDYSSEETQSSGRSRAFLKNVYAADSGIQLTMQRLQIPWDLTAFSYPMTDGTVVESRSRSDAVPQTIADAGIGAPPEGYGINTGQGGGGFTNKLFAVNVTAVAPSNGVVELEAKLGVLQPN